LAAAAASNASKRGGLIGLPQYLWMIYRKVWMVEYSYPDERVVLNRNRRETMALWWWQVNAHQTGGQNFTEPATVNFGSPQNIFVSCALSKYNGNGGSPQADFYITGWVQNGNLVTNQHVYALDANGISEVSLALTVNNATAQGLMVATTNK
jgi:hypothetical protein